MTCLQRLIFHAILNASTGDYVFQAEVAKAIQPEGWQ